MIAASQFELPQSALRLFPTSRPQRERHDECVLAAAKDRLEASGYRELASLHCEVIDGLVVLDGVLPSFYLKQMAQEAVLTLDEVDCVRNLVTVHWPESF